MASREYDEGYKAAEQEYEADGGPAENPYPENTAQADAWEYGYDTACMDLDYDEEDIDDTMDETSDRDYDAGYAEGVAAFKVGKQEDENPYEEGTDSADGWDDGWSDAEDGIDDQGATDEG